MSQKTFSKRVLIPAGIVMFLMILSINVYNISPDIGVNYPAMGRLMSNISALFMLVSIWFGAFIAHPLAYRAGASMRERVLAGLATPWSGRLRWFTAPGAYMQDGNWLTGLSIL